MTCWLLEHVSTTILFPSFIELTGINVCMYVKVFCGVVGYWTSSIACQCVVAIVDVAYPFVMTTYHFFNSRFYNCFDHSSPVRHLYCICDYCMTCFYNIAFFILYVMLMSFLLPEYNAFCIFWVFCIQCDFAYQHFVLHLLLSPSFPRYILMMNM